MAVNYGPSVSTNGLLFCVDAANLRSYPTTGNTWIDLSANTSGLNLLNSPTFTGSTFVFDGINQHADIGSSALNITWSASPTRTVEIWFRFLSLTGLSIWGDQNGSNGILRTTTGTGKFGWRWDDSSLILSNKTMAVGEWAQVVILLSGYTATYYANGELDTPEFTSTDLGVAGNARWSIAKDNRDNIYSNIEVALARQYSRILTSQEIYQNFQANRGRFGI